MTARKFLLGGQLGNLRAGCLPALWRVTNPPQATSLPHVKRNIFMRPGRYGSRNISPQTASQSVFGYAAAMSATGTPPSARLGKEPAHSWDALVIRAFAHRDRSRPASPTATGAWRGFNSREQVTCHGAFRVSYPRGLLRNVST